MTPIMIDSLSFDTFEVVACHVISRLCRVVVVVIYRPGSQTIKCEFFNELASLLEQFAVLNSPTFIVGDFNVRLDRVDDGDAVKLHSTFQAFGFSICSHGPTHRAGGTLDIVAARSPVSVTLIDADIADHKLLQWPVALDKPIVQTFPVYRRLWRHLDLVAFRSALYESALCQPQSWPTDVDAASTMYDDIIEQLLDDMLPVTQITRRQRPTDPWFDADCRAAKRLTRRLERAASAANRRAVDSTSSEVQAAFTLAQTAWLAQRRVYRSLRHQKCSKFWSKEFTSVTSPHQIWSTVDRLLGRGRRPCTDVNANVLSRFFASKVDRVRATTSGSVPPRHSVAPDGVQLLAFTHFTEAEVEAAIRRLPDKSSAADSLPADILKLVADLLSPFLTHLFNLSLDCGKFPSNFKDAFITPILKKNSLPTDDPSSYRPISNLPILSKLLERLVARQLVSFLETNHLLPDVQSGFRHGFSTETAITKVLSDLLDAVDRGDNAILVLLDLSAAFDTVDHQLLQERLQASFGICDAALNWFQSYLTGRTQRVRCGGCDSSTTDLLCGVPQGSVLGPILFIMYTADLSYVVAGHGLALHQYADDSQIYGTCRPSCTAHLSDVISRCTADVAEWMQSNRLQLNADKTDVMWCASTRRVSGLPVEKINIAGADVTPVSTVRDLGVLIDSDLGAASHVRLVVSRCFSALRQLIHLRRYVSWDCFRSLVVALIHSRLDYGNFVLVGLSAYRQRLLQSVLNAAARVTFRLRRRDHITDALVILHWLRVPERIDFKLAVTAYRSLHGQSPSYLNVLQCVANLSNRRQLRSSSSGQVDVPAYRLSTVGRRSFPVAAAYIWNSLPPDIQSASSLTIFRKKLKTFLFRRSFPDLLV